MKIGILTFHRARNYGAVLQCYALSTYLRRCGFDAEIIDYTIPQIKKVYNPIKFSSFKEFVSSLIHLKFSLKAHKNFTSFLTKHVHLSRHHDKPIFDDYDIVIVGSDQVWSPRLTGGLNTIYWGHFKGNAKLISYAASMGEDHNFNKEEQKIIKNNLDKFSGIMVREDSLKNELMQYSPKLIKSVLDPTLLLDKSLYEEIAEDPGITNYVLYYQQEYNPKTKNIVQDVCNQLKCDKIVVMTGYKDKYDVETIHFDLDTLTVPKFLGLVKNAKCMFSSSFHGTAFSVIFRKNFYFVANYSTDRSENLLRKIGAYDRVVTSDDKLLYKDVNYSIIEQNIIREIKRSEELLLSNVKNIF